MTLLCAQQVGQGPCLPRAHSLEWETDKQSLPMLSIEKKDKCHPGLLPLRENVAIRWKLPSTRSLAASVHLWCPHHWSPSPCSLGSSVLPASHTLLLCALGLLPQGHDGLAPLSNVQSVLHYLVPCSSIPSVLLLVIILTIC